ncbi:MAG: Wadjet anti-phage system protein JetD domain-containing protein [Gammaproteobacteria bacterium]
MNPISRSAGSWTGQSMLRAQLQRLWDRGDLLAELVTGESSFPRRLSLKGPSSAEMSEQFDAVRKWIAGLCALPHYRVELRELRHRVLGFNQVPAAVWVDSLDAALAILGKRAEASRFTELVAQTRARRPTTLDWVAAKPHKALAMAESWGRLLDVVDWIEVHPRPNVFLRQVDIPGVDSKFIEAHRGGLSQWLDRILPPNAIDEKMVGVAGFAKRYGFRDKPERVRLRALDPANALLPGAADADLTLDVETCSTLQPAVRRVFITENEINFLAFPQVADSWLLFGAGYGFEQLVRCAWLQHCEVNYWGDIDTHGFAILDRLRAHLPQARSLLMDRATLMAFEVHWGMEDKPTQRDLHRLDAQERALYDALRDNRIRPNLRLEQERIGFEWVRRVIAALP